MTLRNPMTNLMFNVGIINNYLLILNALEFKLAVVKEDKENLKSSSNVFNQK